MSDLPKDGEDDSINIIAEQETKKREIVDEQSQKDIVEKDFIPNFFPTFRISRKLYALPIIFVVICAGILAYITHVVVGIHIEGGYVSESEHGAAAGLINGLIFVAMAAISSFIIIYAVKKGGIGVLKYIFGFSFGLLGFFLTLFFGEIILIVIFYSLPSTPSTNMSVYVIYAIATWILLISTLVFTIIMIWRYFVTESVFTKNIIVLYISLLTGALFGIMMPLWTTIAILIGISLWDIFAVKSKRGPIREMMEIASRNKETDGLTDAEIDAKIESGELEYDTSKLEIGIGDLAFYSMLTSCALIITGNFVVMFLTAIAIIIGTGITIQGLKKNKILPGLPISIFLGISTMMLSWAVFLYIL